jgi:hypothetical protein
MHLLVTCYTLFHFYILLESNDKSPYINYNILFNNKDELKLLIKTKLKLVISEQILFRVYLVELMMYIFNMNIIAPLWSIIFATYYIYYYKYNNINKIAKFSYVFLLSYFILINYSLLVSCFMHCYAETLIIIIRTFVFRKFSNQNTNKKIVIKNNLNKFIPEKLELASKKEVEDMLSGKKFD